MTPFDTMDDYRKAVRMVAEERKRIVARLRGAARGYERNAEALGECGGPATKAARALSAFAYVIEAETGEAQAQDEER